VVCWEEASHPFFKFFGIHMTVIDPCCCPVLKIRREFFIKPFSKPLCTTFSQIEDVFLFDSCMYLTVLEFPE
jgi:hypothetical protein